MKLKQIAGSTLIATLLVMPAAAAAFQTGSDLIKGVNAYEAAERKDPETNFFQLGYYMGLVKGVAMIGNKAHFCLQDEANFDESFAAVATWMKAHPERWDGPDGYLVATALTEAFPCQ